MRKGGGSSKGSSFERDICKQLSRWWTEEARDDVFWRTAGSGGRATNRAKTGQQTAGAYGDISFTDPIGADLLKICCFELKRGYGQWCVLDLIDRKPDAKPCTPVLFWRQAVKSAADANVRHPIVIFRRDQKQTAVMVGGDFMLAIFPYVGAYKGRKLLFEIDQTAVFILPFDEFLDYCRPDAVSQMVRELAI